MKKLLQKIRLNLQRFNYDLQRHMQGRYGFDEFSRFLSIAALVLVLLFSFLHFTLLYLIAFALLIWAWVRSFSRNIYKRQVERNKYLDMRNKAMQKFRLYKNMWRDRKTHKYYKCPDCKAVVRIAKPGKGKKIKICCPKCGNNFEKRT